MQSVLEGIWNNLEYVLKDSQKMAGQLEECSGSKVMETMLNGRTFRCHFGEVGFIYFLSSINFLMVFV